MQAPVESAGWMVSDRAWTTPLESLEPTARTQLSTVRAPAVAGEDSVTDSVVGTVTELVVPEADVTVTTSPDTALTMPLTKAALGLSVGAPGRGLAPAGNDGRVPPGAAAPPWAPGIEHDPLTAWLSRTELAVTWPVASFWPPITTQVPATMSPVEPVLVEMMVVLLV